MRLKKTGQTSGKTLNILQGEVNGNYIGMLERGERNPTYFTLLAVANGLDVELYELIKG